MKRSAAWVLMVLAAGCGGSDSEPSTTTPDAAASDAATNDASASPDGSASDGGSDASSPKPDGGASGRWVTGYYAGYERAAYPVDAIEWSGLTHLAVAFYLPNANGTLDEQLFLDPVNGPALGHALVSAAHANGKKAIASIGGAGMHDRFVSATTGATRATFLANLKKLLTDYAFDGLDLDWEPVAQADEAAVIDVVQKLRAALPGATLTMPVGFINVNAPDDLSLYAKLAPYLDQINIMAYGMAGAYSGWKSWHSSALYQQDSATPTSVDSTVKAYLAANVPAAKLGAGVGFYGLCYSPPVSAPAQALGGSRIVADDGVMSYAHIATTYVTSAAHKFDAVAHVPYLAFGAATGPEGCGYVSYEDAQSIADKGAYVKSKGLGGAMVWTINQGYLASAAAGQRSPLLLALRTSVLQ